MPYLRALYAVMTYLPSNRCTSSSMPPNNMIHSLMVLFMAEAMASVVVLLLVLLLLFELVKRYPSIFKMLTPLMLYMLLMLTNSMEGKPRPKPKSQPRVGWMENRWTRESNGTERATLATATLPATNGQWQGNAPSTAWSRREHKRPTERWDIFAFITS